ncbi:MAG: hypothetical protein ABSA48_15150 [Terracidiphilus sp.]
MKRLLAVAGLCAVSCCLHAQVADATVCDILKAPQSFNGKMVRVKGTVAATFDQFVVKGADCGLSNNNLWLSYPEGTKAKAGPALMVRVQPARNFAGEVPVVVRTPVQLDKSNKDFKQFDSLLSAPFKKGGMCLGCNRYEVTATLVGRLDGVEDATMRRDDAGKITGFGGFGHMNAYSARLVLQSVSDVTAKEIDYSKTLAVTKSDSFDDAATIDSLAAARQAVKAYNPANASGQQLTRAVGAFGKPDENNGVVIAFGNANEAAAKDEVKGTKDSPDGLLYICTFNSNRVTGDAETRAMVYAGENVANLRTPIPGAAAAPLYLLDDRAWVTTILDAVASKQKTLTLPGGYLIWNSTWQHADANQKVEDAVTSFLGTEELLSK